MYKVTTFFLVLLLFGCKSEKITQFSPEETDLKSSIELRFLDEYVFPAKYKFKNTVVGGLSGIDYANNQYYIVVDDSNTPRVYTADIAIKNQKIDTVIFKDVIKLDEEKNPFYAANQLDLESIVVDGSEIILTSEGRISRGADPTIFKTDLSGNYLKSFQLPSKFLANSKEKPRHNGVFEGVSKSYDAKGIWSAMEFPLEADGEKPKYPTTNSPVRFTYYNAKTHQPEKEYLYQLEPLSRKNKGHVNLNGLTDVLEYKQNHFLVIERTYQSGYKNDENLVRVYEAVIEDDTTNSLNISSVKDVNFNSMRKRLLFDFSNVKSSLTDKIIDNIEGITFGPKLSNGNQSLILVSDDNFQKYGNQINQFVLLEIVKLK